MVTVTASNILSYTNYTTSDCSAINVEALTDILIDYINLETGGSIPTFRAVAFPYTGALTLTLSTDQYATVMAGMNLMIRAYKDRGPNTALGPMSVSSLTNDPQYSLFSDMLKVAINRLRGRVILRT